MPVVAGLQVQIAWKPGPGTVPADLKRIVMAVLVPTTEPGEVVPVYLPMRGAAVVDPLKSQSVSFPAWTLKDEKVSEREAAPVGAMVYV